MGERQPPSLEDNKDPNGKDLKPLFELGEIVGTPGALQALQDAEQNPLELLVRHVTGDWRDLDEEDKEENKLSVERDSGYYLPTSWQPEPKSG